MKSPVFKTMKIPYAVNEAQTNIGIRFPIHLRAGVHTVAAIRPMIH